MHLIKKTTLIFTFVFMVSPLFGQDIVREFKVDKQYLNIPVNLKEDRQKVYFVLGHDTLTNAVIRIANKDPDYWVYKDVSKYRDQKLKIILSNDVKGLDAIHLADQFPGEDSLYKESKRPQFHFSTRRGWNNDPNGLVYLDGEYHLFYQHNPYEINWENMHWGHAVSTDLLHWKELDDALYPDHLGTMFSGSAVIDKNNTTGWGKNTLVACYTAAGAEQVQCVAYSSDNGRTFTKYEGNPVVGPTRDPKVIWHEPNQEWVMALYYNAGISFYTSKNLKTWQYESQIKGFYECPEIFELPVDGDPDRSMWVVYGGSGTYMLGDFDGKTYTPEYGKYRNTYGAHYAAQTYNNHPEGRRIQIGWGRIESSGMPFNQMMCFPTELTLRTTNEGIRMFSEPIEAIENLHKKKYDLSELSLSEANEKLAGIQHDLLHVVIRLESLNGSGISINYQGNTYGHMDADEIHGVQTPLPNPESLVFDVEMLIDRTSVEFYYQNGQIVFVYALKDSLINKGLEILGDEKNVKIHGFMIYELLSIWD